MGLLNSVYLVMLHALVAQEVPHRHALLVTLLMGLLRMHSILLFMDIYATAPHHVQLDAQYA